MVGDNKVTIYGSDSLKKFGESSLWVQVSKSSRQLAAAHQAFIELRICLRDPKKLGRGGVQVLETLHKILGQLQEVAHICEDDLTALQSILPKLVRLLENKAALKTVRFELSLMEWAGILSEILDIRGSSQSCGDEDLSIEDRERADTLRAFIDDYLLRAIQKFVSHPAQ